MNWIDELNEDMSKRRAEQKVKDQKVELKIAVGKIIGQIAVESGQLASVRNPSKGGNAAKLVDAQSKAGKAAKLVNAQSKAGKIGGKIGGKKNVESGHLDNIRKDAIKASVESRINKRLDLIHKLYNNIKTNDWFSIDDVIEHYNVYDENGQYLKQPSLFNYLKTNSLFESKKIKTSSGGLGKKYYKKIETLS